MRAERGDAPTHSREPLRNAAIDAGSDLGREMRQRGWWPDPGPKNAAEMAHHLCEPQSTAPDEKGRRLPLLVSASDPSGTVD